MMDTEVTKEQIQEATKEWSDGIVQAYELDLLNRRQQLAELGGVHIGGPGLGEV